MTVTLPVATGAFPPVAAAFVVLVLMRSSKCW
jgi:hypothetical protein